MKVVILCGGKGTRLRGETEHKPKPMLEIGEMPILWHIMKSYAFYGYDQFVLCLGYKGDLIKQYFYNYEVLSNDFTVELGSKKVEIHPRHSEQGWKVTLIDTGQEAMTGTRVKRIESFIEDDVFMLTYGDGVTDLKIPELLEFHKNHGKIGTVTGVSPPSRYGELLIQKDEVVCFAEKPAVKNGLINGGYFVFKKEIFNYLKDNNTCVLERGPLEKLAADGELKVFPYDGFWQCMDTFRDYRYLTELWESGSPPWMVW